MKEVKKLLDSINNIKHKAMISTLYSCGVRLEELLNLKAEDIDSQRMFIRVNSGKGKRIEMLFYQRNC